jgi:hypothetical protein
MTEEPSDRVIDQRARNRIIEAVLTLAQGDEGVRREWPTEYFESFFDWVPYRSAKWTSNTALDQLEVAKLVELAGLVDRASDATAGITDAEEFIATGWPSTIQPLAQETLNLFSRRGRFDEMEEEETPSSGTRWP